MKNLFLSLMVILSFAGQIAFCADSGAVSENTQIWTGRKIFLTNDGVTSTTATGTITLNKDSLGVQRINCDGSARNVVMPPEGTSQSYRFEIVNTSSTAVSITVKASDGSTTVGTITQAAMGFCYCDGTTWSVVVVTAGSAGMLTADGTTTGGTSQTQIFTNGVTTDAIVGNTATPLAIAAKVGSSAVGNPITVTAGAGNGAFNGGAATLAGGASGAGATGAGGAVAVNGGAAASTNGAGGAIAEASGAGIGSGAGGAWSSVGGAGGATGAGGNWSATGGRGGSTSGAAGTLTATAGAGGAATTTAGGIAALVGGGSGTGATGNGGVAKIVGGAALSTDGTGGAAQVTGGVATGTGTGGAVTITSGASAGAGGTAGAIAIDTGAAAGGTGAGITLGGTNATKVVVSAPLVSTPATVQDIATGNTITVPTTAFVKRLTATAGAATGVIVTAGTIDGQKLVVFNVHATNAITFAAAGTSNVADGASSAVAALTGITLVWDSTSSRWYTLK